MKVEELLNRNYEQFGENEKYICHYLLTHKKECVSKPVSEFAKACNVSQTLLVRFAKKLGLFGYSELKARIRLELRTKDSLAKGLLETVTESYHKMMNDLLKRDLAPLFGKLLAAERVFAYGSGSAQTRAASEMKRIFLPAREIIHLHGHDMCRALEKNVTPRDLVILISLSGESAAVVDLARVLRTLGVPCVSITRQTSNTLASLCSENLYINSVQIPVNCGIEYEIATPYFILIEFLYLSYQNYCADRQK